MTIKQLYPALRPSILLDFAKSQVVNPLVTFSRASSATYVAENGVLTEVAANRPRVDFDPVTSVCKGLLIEGQRTNSVTNPRAEGAVAGTPGTLPTGWNTYFNPTGVSRTIVGVGTQNGYSYVDIRFAGTASSTGELTVYLTNSVAASLASSWAQSAYVSIVGGSVSNLAFVSLRTFQLNSGAYVREVATNIIGSLSSTLTRFSIITSSFGSGANQIQPVLSLFASVGGAVIDITLRIAGPQLEQGSTVTSIILPPVGAPAASTRAAESLITTSIGSWFNGATGTIVVQAATLASGTQPIVSFDDNTVNEQMVINTSGTDPKFTVTDGGTPQADLDAGTIIALTTFKMAVAYTVNDFAACVNGLTVQTDVSGTVPTVDRMRIGTDVSANQLVGYIQRIVYYSERLTNDQLVSLTK